MSSTIKVLRDDEREKCILFQHNIDNAAWVRLTRRYHYNKDWIIAWPERYAANSQEAKYMIEVLQDALSWKAVQPCD